MPSGEALRVGRAQQGFTYLLLLFVLAIAGAGLAVLGERWAVAGQREREAELLFRGTQYSRALASWRDATPAGQPTAPQSLDELLVDLRSNPPRHHLRRLFVDPFTGSADWELQRDAGGRIQALSSRSRRPALRRTVPSARPGADPRHPTVGDWVFEPAPAMPTAAPPPRTAPKRSQR
jgi:type II secretory pathway pseudopilin PulG